MFAANLFLDTLNTQCKSEEVIAWTRKFIDMPELARTPGSRRQMIALLSDG